MNIQVRKIRQEGIEIDEVFPVDFAGLTDGDVLRFVSPFKIMAKVSRVENEIFAKVAAESSYETSCCRCLGPVKKGWALEFSLTYEVKDNVEFIEIDEDIRQELILNLPVRVLCQEDCKGLCVDCGINLNAEKCKHEHAVVSG